MKFMNIRMSGWMAAMIAVLIFQFQVSAQCPLSVYQGATGGVPPCGIFSQDLLGSGTYSTVDVITGGNYTFSTCGSSFDTQVTGYTTGGGFLFFNDNDGPDCVGINASVNWVSSISGPIRIMVNRAACQGHDFTGVSAVLKYRQNDNINFNLPATICSSDGVITLNATPTGGAFTGPGVTGTTFDPVAAGAGSHSIIYTFGSCSRSTNITVGGAILNIASQKNPTCNGSSNGEIDITANGGIPPYSFTWSNGATTEDLVLIPAGTYQVTVTDNYNCSSTLSTTLSEPSPMTSTISGTDVSCNGSDDGSATITISGGTAPYSYFWSNFSFSQNLTQVPGGTYSVLATDTFGCTVTNSVTIGQPSAIVISSAVSSPSCGGNDAAVDVTVTGGNPPYTFAWSNGATTEDLINVAAGTYTLTVTDASACTNTHSVAVPLVQDSLNVSFTTTNNVCVGNSISITNTTTNVSGQLFYFWDFGDGSSSTVLNPSHTYDTPGSYLLALRVLTNQGCVDSFSESITVFPLPDATIAVSPDAEICDGENVTLTAPSGLTAYSWSEGSSTASIIVKDEGTYSVTVTDENGCSAEDDVFITVLPLPDISITPDTNVIRGFSIELEATGGVFYDWTPIDGLDNPNSPNPTATPLETITYTVVVTDVNGCINNASVTIDVIEAYLLVIPNVITPNGNGQNDFWAIKNIRLYNNEVQIFNRWGTMIYSTKEYQNDWDGTHDGNELSNGTYYYVINLENGTKIYKGAVTILR